MAQVRALALQVQGLKFISPAPTSRTGFAQNPSTERKENSHNLSLICFEGDRNFLKSW